MMSASNIFAATSGTYEYNDYSLYSTNGTWYSSGALRSNNGSLDTFTITVNVNNNTWSITGGTSTNIPFPAGTSIYYTDRTTFLQSAYATINGTRYNFTFIDNSGVFYLQNIPAGPYYPTVTIYLPTSAGSLPAPPTTPTLIQDGDFIKWTPADYPARLWYNETGQGASEIIQPTLYGPSINIGSIYVGEGYYYIQLIYEEEGVTKYSDVSNRIYLEWSSSNDPNDHDSGPLWNILQYLQNLKNSTKNAFNIIKQSCEEFFDFMSDLVAWLPNDVTSVFFAVVIIGLVIGLFLK